MRAPAFPPALKPVRAWMREYWLILLLPAVFFLVAAGVTRQLYRTAQATNHRDWQASYAAAVEAGIQGNRESALRQMMQAAQSAPDDPIAQSQLAMAFNKLGQDSRAVAHLEKAIRLQTSASPDPEGFLGLVEAYVKLGEFAKAEQMLDGEVLPRWPDSAKAHYLKGFILFETDAGGEHLQAARGEFEKSLALAPSDPRARYYRGLCQLRLGEDEEAIASFKAVLEKDPFFSSTYHGLATALRRVDRPEEADQALSRFQELESKQRRVRHLELQVQLEKATPPELFELGRHYFDLQQLSKAEIAFRRFTREDPTNPDGYLYLTRIYRGQANEKEALRVEKLAEALSRVTN